MPLEMAELPKQDWMPFIPAQRQMAALSTQGSAGGLIMAKALSMHIDSMVREVVSAGIHPSTGILVYVGACGTLPCFCCFSCCPDTWHLPFPPSHALLCSRPAYTDHE